MTRRRSLSAAALALLTCASLAIITACVASHDQTWLQSQTDGEGYAGRPDGYSYSGNDGEPGVLGSSALQGYFLDLDQMPANRAPVGAIPEPSLAPEPSAASTKGSLLTELEDIRMRQEAVPGKAQPAAKRTAPIAHAAPGEELWIISTPPQGDAASAASSPTDPTPESGALLALPQRKPDADPDAPRTTDLATETIPLPLKHTDVRAAITGYLATVDVTQQFHNPFDTKIEAVYVFPLPQDAAVSEFVMTIGDRQIRGLIREKEEAEQLYAQAKAQGYRAALLTQQRPNIFTQKVANIEPGKAIDISIRYFNTLAYAHGQYHFVFPIVVGPRFNPPHTQNPITPIAHGTPPQKPTDSIRGTPGTTTPYLKPHQRPGNDIALTVHLNPGVPLTATTSHSHPVTAQPQDDGSLNITLANESTIPNKDFVLSFKVTGDRINSGLVTHTDDSGQGYFSLMLFPPDDLQGLTRQPMEMVFVLDCSGSMSGKPIHQAKAAIKHALQQLQPDDTFQVIRFSQDASAFGPNPVPATPDNITKALKYVDNLRGSGGTHMIEGIRAALNFPHDPQRYRTVTFLTDGFIGNEQQILAAIHQDLGQARIFSFGVGSSPNRYLMNRMAKAGRGAAAYLALDDDATAIMDFYFQRIAHPAITDLNIDWGTMQIADVYPSRLPDLFVDRPVILTGTFTGKPSTVQVTGRAGRYDLFINPVTADTPPTPAGPELAQVWARQKIADLHDQLAHSETPDDLRHQIKTTALDYSLMSNYTAFLAVDTSEPTTGTHGVTVPVALPVPDGVRYDTTVPE
ncbi:MAG: VIT domain-containing protein [Planctomycetota bacterium]